MDLAFNLALGAVLLLAGLVFGRAAEWRHYRRLRAREAALRDVLVFTERRVPAELRVRRTLLVVGSVVIAEDYFKRSAAALKTLVGGRLTTYESLIDRGRREAVVRMKDAARRLGADMVFSVRFETTALGADAAGAQGTFAAAFMVYGTALVRDPEP